MAEGFSKNGLLSLATKPMSSTNATVWADNPAK